MLVTWAKMLNVGLETNRLSWQITGNTLNRTEWLYMVVLACLVAQSYLTLRNPMDCSPPASSVHGTSQARVLEWVPVSFSMVYVEHTPCVYVKAKSQGRSWHLWVGQIERQLSHLLILRALAEEQIREKRFGANNSGHVELEVPSVEMSSRQFSNGVWDLTCMTMAAHEYLAAMPTHNSPPGLAGGSSTQLQVLGKQSPRLVNQASSQNYNWNTGPRPRQELSGECGDPGHRNAGWLNY